MPGHSKFPAIPSMSSSKKQPTVSTFSWCIGSPFRSFSTHSVVAPGGNEVQVWQRQGHEDRRGPADKVRLQILDLGLNMAGKSLNDTIDVQQIVHL